MMKTKNLVPNDQIVYRSIEDYLALPYTIKIMRDSSDDYIGWFAEVVELRGCITQGDTREEAVNLIEDAMRGWIETAIEDKFPIPEPENANAYSGKFIIRVPKNLHRELAETAKYQGVSLNLFAATALAKAVNPSTASFTA